MSNRSRSTRPGSTRPPASSKPAAARSRWRPAHAVASAALFLLGVLAGCGNLTAGGIGEAAVSMSADAPDDGSSPQMAVVSDLWSQADTLTRTPALDLSGPTLSDGGSDPKGEVEAELTVLLVAADGTAVALTDGEVRVRTDLEGVEEPEIGSRSVGATTYTALRMVFTEIEARVEEGLIIDGQLVTGLIRVEIDDADLPVDRTLDLEIPDGGRADLLIDLNAESWLEAVDPLTRTVDPQVFGDLVTVQVR